MNGSDLSNFDKMASTTKIHPVRFNHLQHCSKRDANYRQLVLHGDETQFQMGMELCAPDVNMIQNPAFSSTANWNPSGTAFIDTVMGFGQKYAGGSLGIISQIVPVADGVQIYLSFDVNISTGSLKLAAGTYTEIITESGTYERFITADSLILLVFEGSAPSSWTITSVGMYVMNTNFAVRVVDLDDTVIREMNPITDPQYFDFTRSWFTFSYDWEDALGDLLPAGCYRFLVSEPCECLNGGLIPQDLITGVATYWQQSGVQSWFVVGGSATYTGAVDGDTVWIENVFCDDVDYEVGYTLTGMAGNEFRLRAGATSSILRTADGTYTEIITANGNTGRLVLAGYNTAGASTFILTDLTITPVSRSYAFRSNIFDLRASAECTCIISACCDSDNLQAGFPDTNFVPRIRLKLNYGDAEYDPISNESFKGSFGFKRNYYYRGEKIKRIGFAASEYVHDFIAHLGGYDYVYLDGESVFVNSSEYSVEWQDGYDYGEGELKVSDKQELIEKKRCSTQIKGCGSGGLSISIDSNSGGASGSDGAGIITNHLSSTAAEYLTDG